MVQGGFHPTAVFRRRSMLSGSQSDAAMNNTCFIFLIRRDHVLGLTAHLAAGILALLLLTGAARSRTHAVPQASAVSPTVPR